MPKASRLNLQSDKYTPAQLLDLRAEQQAAAELGLTWKQRGPPPSEEQQTWRGQQYREGSQRWGNRGGSNKEWYVAYYKAKRAGSEQLQAFLAANPHPTK